MEFGSGTAYREHLIDTLRERTAMLQKAKEKAELSDAADNYWIGVIECQARYFECKTILELAERCGF